MEKKCLSVDTIASLRALINELAPKNIGLVPTMGALHEGHAALIGRARDECDLVVVSVFVNPLQFGPREDLDRYPRNLPLDKVTAAEAGADIVFAPDVREIVGAKMATVINVNELDTPLCGLTRPGHFSGVAVIVAKLFNIVQPNKAFFGEKDWQQLQVVRRMTDDLNFDIEIVPVPTVRDPDGLALSSRNRYLSPDERRAALVLPRALETARNMVKGGELNPAFITAAVGEMIAAEPGVELEYFSICRPETLKSVDSATGDVLLAAAVQIGRTRLIDNVVIWS